MAQKISTKWVEGQCFQCGEIRKVRFSKEETQRRRKKGLSLSVHLCKSCEEKLESINRYHHIYGE